MADREDFATAVGERIKAHIPTAQENAAGRLGLDSAGGVQHSVGGTRVWWVNDKGDLVQGRVPRIENALGRLTLDSAGGVQHVVNGTRVFWINDQGEVAQGTVPWERITGAPSASTSTPGALKTVPLALTTGWGGQDQNLERAARIPFRYNAQIGRWRVHIRNWNPRVGLARGTVSVTGLWLGTDNGVGGFTEAPTQLAGAFDTPADGSEWVSDWLDAEIGGDVQRLLAFGYTATEAPHGMAGGSYHFAVASQAAEMINPVAPPNRSTPLDWWIEAETPASTPVIAGFGDSLTTGVGATFPVHESWLSIYCRGVGALPYHSSHGGDSMRGIISQGQKVDRWANLARADAVVWSMGSNDIAVSEHTLTQMQDNFATVLPLVEKHVGPVRYVSTVQPRNAWDAAKETERVAWNDWVTSQPWVRGVLDFASVASADGDTIRPEYNADGTHLNTAGYAAEAASITTPLAAPALASAARVDALEAGSGIRDVTTLLGLSVGTALLEVRRGDVRLEFIGAQWPESGSPFITDTGLASVAPELPRAAVNEPLLVGANALQRIMVTYTGSARLFSYTEGTVVNGSLSWPMSRPAPTTWPGAATT